MVRVQPARSPPANGLKKVKCWPGQADWGAGSERLQFIKRGLRQSL